MAVIDTDVASLVHEVNPLQDPAWSRFVARHSAASVFQTAPWLEALHRTYGYEPVALATRNSQDEIANGLVFCRVRSWITGRRLVALPFSDHCEPLLMDRQSLSPLIAELQRQGQIGRENYVEMRPISASSEDLPGFRFTHRFILHRLDLRPGAAEVFRRLDGDCIRRKIRRAERERIEIRLGFRSDAIADFYNLVQQTRRRHRLPPQPLSWFANIGECLGEAAQMHLAYKDGQAIAGIITLRHGKTLYYKYGASNDQFHKLGGMPYLLWTAIEDGLRSGFEELDMGRTAPTDVGLAKFKDRFGASRSEIFYWRLPLVSRGATPASPEEGQMVRRMFRYLPPKCLNVLGKFLYRHIG